VHPGAFQVAPMSNCSSGFLAQIAPIAASHQTYTKSDVERIWHMKDNLGQILALPFRQGTLKNVQLFPLHSEAGSFKSFSGFHRATSSICFDKSNRFDGSNRLYSSYTSLLVISEWTGCRNIVDWQKLTVCTRPSPNPKPAPCFETIVRERNGIVLISHRTE